MVAQVISSLLLCVTLFFSLGVDQKKKRLVQRAFVIEHDAIVYNQPDFDSSQIIRLPHNKIIAISTRIYRPKNLFGSFYKVFINKPKKIRGYISEIDVIPQYKYVKKKFVLNEEYANKESILKEVKQQSYIQSKKEEELKAVSKKSSPEVKEKEEVIAVEPPIEEKKSVKEDEKKMKEQLDTVPEQNIKEKESELSDNEEVS